jgi:two-component system, LytTR family, sensor kinase
LSTAPSTGIGLRNCRERLHLIYGARASLELREEGGGITTRLTLPYAAA